MINNVAQNTSFSATTGYVLGKGGAQIIGGSVMGDKPDIIAQEFLMSRDLNPEIQRPVYHLMQSYSYQDAATKDLSDAFKLDRAIEYFAGLVVSSRQPELLRQADKTEYKQQVAAFIETELYEYQWFCAAHHDTKHEHTHFVASRINLVDGRCIATWQDQERSHRICREMEQEHGLQPLKSFYQMQRRSPTRGQKETWEQTGVPPMMVVMQDAIDLETTPGRSVDAVRTALQENHGIEMKIGSYKGKPGVVFEKADSQGDIVRMSGSQLGRGYTLPAIQRRLELDIELQPPGDKSEIETIPDSEPLEQVRREQTAYAERLIPQIKEIWQRVKSDTPNLESATFEDYQIRLSQENHLELYRGDRLVLGQAQGKYGAYGLTEQDCIVMERFYVLSQQQAPAGLEEQPEPQKQPEPEVQQGTEVQPELQEQLEPEAAARQARREYYRDRYQHYAPEGELAPEQQDFQVAVRALQEGYALEEAVLIVAHGDYTQALKHDQGGDLAWDYALSLTQQAAAQLERYHQRTSQLEL